MCCTRIFALWNRTEYQRIIISPAEIEQEIEDHSECHDNYPIVRNEKWLFHLHVHLWCLIAYKLSHCFLFVRVSEAQQLTFSWWSIKWLNVRQGFGIHRHLAIPCMIRDIISAAWTTHFIGPIAVPTLPYSFSKRHIKVIVCSPDTRRRYILHSTYIKEKIKGNNLKILFEFTPTAGEHTRIQGWDIKNHFINNYKAF